MFKRIFLFMLTNVLVVVTISILLSILGVNRYIERTGGRHALNYQSLLIVCLVWGFVGAFISLLLSKVMAKWSMGLKVIDPRTASGNEGQLLHLVHRLARQSKLSAMPEVAIY